MSKYNIGRGIVVAVAAVALLSLSALAASPADAARSGAGGPRGSGGAASIALNEVDPHLGDWVTFATNGGSRIAVACYQGGLGNMVYSADQPTGTAFLLGEGSSTWQADGADALCYAWLYSRSLNKGSLAATSFSAGGAR